MIEAYTNLSDLIAIDSHVDYWAFINVKAASIPRQIRCSAICAAKLQENRDTDRAEIAFQEAC